MQGTVSVMAIEDMMAQFGWQKVRLADGVKRYITRDERGRAVVGPEVGQRRRKVTWWRRKSKEETAVTGSRLATVSELAGLSMKQQMKFPTIRIVPPRPPQKVSVLRRLGEWFVDRFYDHVWHQAMRNCAADVLMWSVAVATVVALGRGVLWLLSM